MESFLERVEDVRIQARPQSVQLYRAFATFLLGHLLLETSTTIVPGSDTSVSEDIAFLESNDLAEYPLVTEYAEMLSVSQPSTTSSKKPWRI